MNFNIPALTPEFYLTTLPVLSLCVGALIAMLQGVSRRLGGENAVFAVVVLSLAVSLAAAVIYSPAVETSYLNGSYLAGVLARFGQTLILVIALTVVLLFRSTFLHDRFLRGEITALYLMIVTGMLVTVASEDLVTLFVGLELSSIGLYALVGYLNPSRRSQEGAIKYFVLGSFAAALLLFGFSLLYVATGSLRLSEISQAAPKLLDHNWVRLGVVFSLVGLSFKLALAPFHLWAPDTYEAAPTGLTALMATTVKAMILVLVARFFAGSLASVYHVWLPALMFAATVSMILGNIMALVQTSLKRMLAYSSIAHSGYMAIAICAIGGGSGSFPIAAVLYYLLGYSIISLGAFGVLMWLENQENDNLILDDITGLAKKHPWAALAMAVFMFSFAGMPPTVGFIGKFFVFNAAITNQLYGLVIIGVIGSSISLFYYLRVIVRMYMVEPVKVAVPLAPVRSLVVTGILAVAVLANLALGTLFPETTMKWMVNTSKEVATSPLNTSATGNISH